MADNVDFQTAALATPANATKVATDQLAGGEHVQFFKLMDGTLDGSSKATVGANGLHVELRPGTSLIGTMKLSDGVDTALVSAAGELSVDMSDRSGRLLGVIASITAAVDVSDRDARLVGRIKNLDSAGAVIDPALKGQLPAALVGGRLDVNLGASGITLPVSLAAAVDVSDRAARLLGVLSTGSNVIGSVKLTDGTDTALVTASGMVQVMQARDISRVNISIKFNSAAAPAADTICSCVKNTDGVDAAGATTFAITAGKRFRVQGIKLSVRTTTAATPWGEATVRMNPSGAAVIGSPIVHRLTVGGTAAVIGNVAADYYFFIEGWEVSGTQQICITFANNVATNVTDIVLFGYEYTP